MRVHRVLISVNVIHGIINPKHLQRIGPIVHNVNQHAIMIRKGVLITIIGLVSKATKEVVFQLRDEVLNW